MPAPRATPLSAALDAAGITREEVADALGVRRSFAEHIIRQEAKIPAGHVPTLARLLGLAPDDIEQMGLLPQPIVARKLLKEQGISRADLPELLGLSAQTIRAGLSGHRRLSLRVRTQLAELLDVPVELVGRPDDDALLCDEDCEAVSL
jgi:transcriptional regulator with XRE-family HTH domain